MPLYEITSPEGVTYEIEGPEGATKAQIVAAIEQKLAAQQPLEEPEETTFLGETGEFIKGVPYGALGLLESAALGASSLLPDEIETGAREGIKDIATTLKSPFEAERGYEETTSRKFAEALGSTAPFFALGPLGAVGRVGAAGLGVGAGAGEASERAIAAGATPGEQTAATGLGAIVGVTEVLPVFKFIDNLGKPLTDGIMSRLRRVAATGGAEGLQEASAQVAQNLIAKGLYDPEQGVFTDSGEALGYGAGVGGLIQALTDLALGRRAKKAAAAEEEARKAEEAAAAAAPVLPEGEGAQGELFPQELAEAEEAELGFVGPRAEAAPEAAPAEEEAPVQPDMIDMAEEQQLEELFAEDRRRADEEETRQIEDMLAADEAEATAAEAERQRMQMESDIAELTGRRETEQAKASQQQRLDILLPIIDNVEITNIPRKFTQELKKQGLRETDINEDEKRLINRAYDIRKAEEVDTTLPAAPDETPEGLVPEKATTREPEQMGFPGMGQKRLLERGILAERQAPTPEAPQTLDDTWFDSFGIKKQAPIRKRLQGKTFDDNRVEIRGELMEYAANPNIAPDVSQRIRDYANSPLFMEQAEMFGPRGGITKDAARPRTRREPTGVSPEGGVGPVDAGRTRGGAGRVGAPERAGLGAAGGAAAQPAGREGRKPAALDAFTEQAIKNAESGSRVKSREVVVEMSIDDYLNLAAPGTEKAKTKGLKDVDQFDQIPHLSTDGEQVTGHEGRHRARRMKELGYTTMPVRIIDKNVRWGENPNTRFGTLKAEEGDFSIPHPVKRGDYGTYWDRAVREEPKAEVKEAKPKTVRAKRKAAAKPAPHRKKRAAAVAAKPAGRVAEQPVEKPTRAKPKVTPTEKAEKPATTRTAEKVTPKKAEPKVKKVKDTPDQVLEEVVSDEDRFAQGWVKSTDAKGNVKWEPPKKSTTTKKAKAAPKEPTKEEDGNAAWQELATPPLKKFHQGIAHMYVMHAPREISTKEDANKVQALLRGNPKTMKAADRAVYNYFLKMPRQVDNLINIAFDYVYNTPQFRRTTETLEEAKFFEGMNGKNAKVAYEWVKENLSPEANRALDKFIRAYEIQQRQTREEVLNAILLDNEAMSIDETVQDYLDATNKEQTLKLRAGEIVEMAMPPHPAIAAQLANGDLRKALAGIGIMNPNTVFGRAATKLVNAVEKTKVEVVDDLVDEAGERVAGLYDPKTDTIQLDSRLGINTHTILHEATHAATSHVLAKPGHPATRQLKQLYEDVKDSLDTAYGAQSLDEFVAEAFSNPEFQAKLQAINPKGEPITAWTRFTHAVGNMLRRLIGMETRGLKTALDKADVTITSILSPAPDTRNAGQLYAASMLGKGKEVLNTIGQRYQKLDPLTQGKIDSFHEFFARKIPGTVKNVVRMSLPLNALVDIAQKYIPMAPRVDAVVQEKMGSENRRNQKIEPIIRRVEEWYKKHPDKLDTLNEVIYASTLDQVDPSKPRNSYADNDQKLEVWDKLQKDWKALGPEGQSVYKQMRDTYKKLYEEIGTVLEARLAEGVENADVAKKVKKDIWNRIFDNGAIEPYFPLTRSGKYWLSYNAFDPRTNTTEMFVEAFETDRARDRAIAELKAAKDAKATDFQKFANLSQVNYKRAPSTSFMNTVLKTLDVNKVDPKVKEEVMTFFINMLPETSFAQGFRHRKGTAGFKRDAVGALRTKSYNLSRQLANIEYGAKLENLRSQIDEHVREQGNEETTVGWADELNKRIDFAINPHVPMWSKLATSFGFTMTLGFNVSSAMVNLTQIPLVVMPYLGGKYGYGVTTKALGAATRVFTNSGFDREVEMLVPTDSGDVKRKVRAFPSLDNYDFDATSTPPEIRRLKMLSEVALERGQLNRSLTYDILDVDDSATLLTKVNAASGFVFHHGERMNRQVAMVATYNLELDAMKKKGRNIDEAAMREAAEYAVYVTELTNGGTVAAAAPRIAQGPLGKVLFMFKRYGVSMYYMLFKTAREALKDADPEVRKIAKRQIAGIYASSALLAGVQGVPLYGIAAMAYNLILADDDDDDFDTAARKWMGEVPYSGAVNNLLGVEVASRVGLSDLVFRDNKVRDQQSVMLSLMETMGGPVLGVTSRMERGLSLISEGNIDRGIEQMLPSAIGNALKSVRFGTEGARTLRGDPITGELGPWNTFAQFFGFAPAEYTRQLEINSNTKKIERNILQKRTKLLRNYYIAMRNGDSKEAADIMREIARFSREHPGVAISADTVNRSIRRHLQTSAGMYHGITINKSLRPELMQNISEYNGD